METRRLCVTSRFTKQGPFVEEDNQNKGIDHKKTPKRKEKKGPLLHDTDNTVSDKKRTNSSCLEVVDFPHRRRSEPEDVTLSEK